MQPSRQTLAERYRQPLNQTRECLQNTQALGLSVFCAKEVQASVQADAIEIEDMTG
jgi:hypothetical protein